MHQSRRGEPVEHAIERDAINRWRAERVLDLVVGECRRCRTQQAQYPDTRRRCPRASAPYVLGDRISVKGLGRGHVFVPPECQK